MYSSHLKVSKYNRQPNTKKRRILRNDTVALISSAERFESTHKSPQFQFNFLARLCSGKRCKTKRANSYLTKRLTDIMEANTVKTDFSTVEEPHLKSCVCTSVAVLDESLRINERFTASVSFPDSFLKCYRARHRRDESRDIS